MKYTKEEVLGLWVDALTNGEYVQSTENMHVIQDVGGNEIHTFCVMGVLCDLYQRYVGGLTETRWENILVKGAQVTLIGYEGRCFEIPAAVKKWAGMKAGDRSYLDLLMANDKGVPFSELADMIRHSHSEIFAAHSQDAIYVVIDPTLERMAA